MTAAHQRRAFGAAIALATLVPAALAFQANAQTAKTEQTPVTSWKVNGVDAVDGLGSYLVPSVVPTAGAGQATENKWSMAHVFRFAGNAAPFGVISLDTDGTNKFATLQVHSGAAVIGTERFPYDWGAGKAYFTLVTFLPGNVLAGFVYDNAANAWSFIGTVRVQASWGRLSATSSSALIWYGGPQNDCSMYPAADYFRFAPFGFVAGEANFRQSTALANDVTAGDCTATVANEPLPTESWRHYKAGAAAAATTTSTSTSTSVAPTSSTSSTSSTTASTSSTSTTPTTEPTSTTAVTVTIPTVTVP